MCNGRGCTEHWANMVVVERRNQSKNLGLARTIFPCLKKATASPLQHHSVMTGYCEGVVPRRSRLLSVGGTSVTHLVAPFVGPNGFRFYDKV